MTFEEYVSALTEALELTTIDGFDRSKGLMDELGLDSLEAFELVLATEELAGLSEPSSTIPAIFTLSDAYQYYLKCQERAALMG